MDLSAIYSKTPKGLRARASLIGGISSHLMKVLAHVDGSTKTEDILLKFDRLSPQQLSADLTKLLQEGFIRLATVSVSSNDSWALTTNFAPMVVEEYQSEEELELTTQAKIQEQIRLSAEQQAIQAQEVIVRKEDVRLAAELKANKKAQKLRTKEKTRAEIKVKAKLAQEEQALQVAKELDTAQKKAEAESKVIAEQSQLKAKIESERLVKEAEDAQQKAELKLREAAEQADAAAEQKAKESARREIDRIAKEAEEAQRKQVAQKKAKLEAEHKAAEQEELAKIQAKVAANIEAETKQKEKFELAKKAQATENARLEIATIVRKAEQDRKQTVANAKEEKIEAKRIAKAQQETQAKAEKKLKDAAKEQVKAEQLVAKKAVDKSEREAHVKMAQEKMAHVKLAQDKLAQEKMAQVAHLEDIKSAAKQAEVAAEELLQQQLQLQQVEQDQLKLQQENQAFKTQKTADIIRANANNEEQATIAANENARIEMARIAHEADLIRQKHLVDQHKADLQVEQKKNLPILNDFDAAEADEEASFEAEELAAAKKIKVARKIEKTNQQALEDSSRAHIKQTAIEEAAQKISLQPHLQKNFASKQIKKIALCLVKLLLIYVPIGLIILIGLLHFINISMLIKPIEQIATNAVGAPVTISKVHASVWPQAHLVLEDVAIGTDSANQKIAAIHVLPVVSSLFDDIKIVKSLVIESATIQHTNFSQALGWINNTASAKNLKIEQVNLKDLRINIQDLHLEPFDGKLNFTESQTIKSIDLVSSSNAIAVTISPLAGNYNINLKTANWALPFNSKIIFSALDATGVISKNQIEFSQITGEIYGGNLIAKTKINWPENNSQWAYAGSFNLAAADTPLLLTAFGSSVSVDGKLKLDGSVSGQAKTANQLAKATNMTANFNISRGSIGDIELARAVIARGSQSLAGDATNFDNLTGSVKINQGQYQYSKLALASSQFHANGYLSINENEKVSGKINANLAAQSRRLQANFTITGRGKDLKSN